jgi:hypothetical protein
MSNNLKPQTIGEHTNIFIQVPIDVSPRANSAGANQFGTKWLKALYRGYTDQSFSQYSEQPPYQGTQGPTLRGEVGDLIEIMFVNKMRKNYATMHSMGLDYTKHSEGADYPNTTTPNASNTLSETNAVPPIQAGIAPQGCVVYKWLVPDSAGPNPSQPARTHSYHSYVSLEQDSNAGLIGPTIVYRKGEMANTMASYREIPLLYMIYNEANSFLSASNAANLMSDRTQTAQSTTINTSDFPPGNSSIWLPQITNLLTATLFPDAPSFYTMNGYIFANNPTYSMCLNEKVIWYVNAYGAASHVFHLHGNGVSYLGNNEYAVSINDGVGKTLVMDAVGEGLWQVICHVDNHHALGMVSNYRVSGRGECEAAGVDG